VNKIPLRGEEMKIEGEKVEEKVGSGDDAPPFCLPDQDGAKVCLDEFSGRWLVLYFYPKDNTSGCTREALDFTERHEAFRALGVEVLGISPDSPKSHQKFREKHSLSVRLLSDPDHRVLSAYGAWGAKKMYGKEYQGVLRSTAIVDPEGKIARIWKNVRVKGHVEEVGGELKSLTSKA
jgi:peroxiredoxin Q/BCP